MSREDENRQFTILQVILYSCYVSLDIGSQSEFNLQSYKLTLFFNQGYMLTSLFNKITYQVLKTS